MFSGISKYLEIIPIHVIIKQDNWNKNKPVRENIQGNYINKITTEPETTLNLICYQKHDLLGYFSSLCVYLCAHFFCWVRSTKYNSFEIKTNENSHWVRWKASNDTKTVSQLSNYIISHSYTPTLVFMNHCKTYNSQESYEKKIWKTEHTSGNAGVAESNGESNDLPWKMKSKQ